MTLTRPWLLTSFAAALLIAQGIYGLVSCWLENDWDSALWCGVAIFAGLGLAGRRMERGSIWLLSPSPCL